MFNVKLNKSRELADYYEVEITFDTGTSVVTVNPGMCTITELQDMVASVEENLAYLKNKVPA